ncbi:MAG: TRAP transporter small permease subunit [Alphaproteobacteria bacterium]
MNRFANHIDTLNRTIASAARWLVVAMALVQFANAVLRHVFSISFIQMSEAVWYLHGLFFTLGAGYALLCDDHVRIDIIYGRLALRTRAIINLAGTFCLLLPVCAAVIWFSADYVAGAWRIREGSAEFGGLPFLYVLKTGIWAFAFLLGLQGLALAIRSAAQLSVRPACPSKYPSK